MNKSCPFVTLNDTSPNVTSVMLELPRTKRNGVLQKVEDGRAAIQKDWAHAMLWRFTVHSFTVCRFMSIASYRLRVPK